MSLINEFCIQLYTLRGVKDNDYDGLLRTVGQIGFKGVEFYGGFGFGGHSVKEFKSLLADCGMRVVSAHVGLEDLRDKLDEQLELYNQLGAKYIILPWLDMKTREDVLAFAGEANQIGRKVSAAGLKFGYHNHSHEFAADGGEYLLDIFYENTDPHDVIAQLDVGWVKYAGVDPAAYIRKLGSRVRMLHLKQIGKDKKDCDLGDGVVDFRSVIEAGKEQNVDFYILEQEEFDIDPVTSSRNGYNHIMEL
ncbi:MAG: sugar phosphate isomerase/epimerase [Defluviitaleaceae bacterium]|nr:sugar phosphate isomerase/epimerase [Defluviitaleaceae bacterium]